MGEEKKFGMSVAVSVQVHAERQPDGTLRFRDGATAAEFPEELHACGAVFHLDQVEKDVSLSDDGLPVDEAIYYAGLGVV